MMKRFLYSIIIVFCYGCTITDPDGKEPYYNFFPDSYILGFVFPDSISYCSAEINYPCVDRAKKTVCFKKDVSSHVSSICIFVLFESKGLNLRFIMKPGIHGTDRPEINLYHEKVQEIGDTHFMKYDEMFSRYYAFSPPSGEAINGTIKELSISCNQTIDEQHPAGSDISDLFDVFFEDLYWVVQNEYRTYEGADAYTRHYDIPPITSFPYALRRCSVSEFLALQRPYISRELWLYAEDLHLAEGTYTFTISALSADGRQSENTCSVEWKVDS